MSPPVFAGSAQGGPDAHVTLALIERQLVYEAGMRFVRRVAQSAAMGAHIKKVTGGPVSRGLLECGGTSSPCTGLWSVSDHSLSAWTIAMLLAGAHVVPMKSLLEIALKALVGGLSVVVFALVAETIEPKRLAGVFAAAPSVALAGLILTVVFKGDYEALDATRGMVAGALAFTVYCLVDVPALGRLGAKRGSVVALVVWGVVAAAFAFAVAS